MPTASRPQNTIHDFELRGLTDKGLGSQRLLGSFLNEGPVVRFYKGACHTILGTQIGSLI